MTEALIKGPHEPRFQAADVVEATVAQEDVPDAGGIDGGREQPPNQAEAAALSSRTRVVAASTRIEA
jgi:hypothetical protein